MTSFRVSPSRSERVNIDKQTVSAAIISTLHCTETHTMVSTRSRSTAQVPGNLPSEDQATRILASEAVFRTPAILPPEAFSKAAATLPTTGLPRKGTNPASNAMSQKEALPPMKAAPQTIISQIPAAPTRIAGSVILPPPHPYAQVRPTTTAQPRALPKIPKTTAKTIAKKGLTKGPSATKLQDKTNTSLKIKKSEHKPKPVARIPNPKPLSTRSKCVANGPNGPKVYDEAGFELSYKKCASVGRAPRRSHGAQYFAMLEREAEESRRKEEIMGTRREHVSALTSMAWNDRVARELGIPYHKVEMKHFEELARRGFKAKEGEFEAANMSKEEQERLTKLCTGSAFRA